MGVARLLAKGWVVFCLFAGGYVLDEVAATAGGSAFAVMLRVLLIVLLFGAMGLLFAGGYAAAVSSGEGRLIERFRPHHVIPGFNAIVFMVFALASFLVQTLYLPEHAAGGILDTLQNALEFAVPGQARLKVLLLSCGLDGGRMFASAFAWLLAFIFLGSSLSRIRLAAGIVRLERKQRPEPLTPTGLAALLGFCAVVGIQLLYVGSLYTLVPCGVARGITGDLLVGLAPLLLAYLIVAALTNLLALGPEA